MSEGGCDSLLQSPRGMSSCLMGQVGSGSVSPTAAAIDLFNQLPGVDWDWNGHNLDIDVYDALGNVAYSLSEPYLHRVTSVNRDVVFGLAPTRAAVDVVTLRQLLENLLKNPALVLVALSLQSIGDADLPARPSRCPDKEHFQDPLNRLTRDGHGRVRGQWEACKGIG